MKAWDMLREISHWQPPAGIEASFAYDLRTGFTCVVLTVGGDDFVIVVPPETTPNHLIAVLDNAMSMRLDCVD